MISFKIIATEIATASGTINFLASYYERTFTEEKEFPRRSAEAPIKQLLAEVRSQSLAFSRLLLSGTIICGPRSDKVDEEAENIQKLTELQKNFFDSLLTEMFPPNFVVDLIHGCDEEVNWL